ncbi:hypothetical protein N7466_010050 [Penicillium verhagenii]|uniref:uncharacterized protein n=1 Tax=Penicillium verhagenii TaxID=1562060 RepID=UPI002545BA3C|nr:uncharacterized protein N7466_010050 [Penicillium verhagenii]KAJ5919107.1 hypothetical protein N7466_010050 [Penicillium verhagenii]
MPEPKTLVCADYSLTWICALPLELAAAEAMLDETHPRLTSTGTAHIAYTLGKIAGHNTVIACLPSGVYATVSATFIVSQIQSTFPNVRYGVMVGIGGGVPSAITDIRLGDVVVSKPTGSLGGVVHYDLGKTIAGGHFQQTGMLNQPPTLLLTAVSKMQADDMRKKDNRITRNISEVFEQHPDMQPRFSRPLTEDRLFRSTYTHLDSEKSCIDCDVKEQIDRDARTSREARVHYGVIASGNRVIKDGMERDSIAKKFDALCFEMEAAGIMNHLPCLVVRGICDYCDSHKNKEWQEYAALVAAIYTKDLLSMIPIETPASGLNQISGIWIPPFEQNPRFLGRGDEISQLKDRIISGKYARKVAISGLGGMGKTQIALELAYQIHHEDPTYSIFWIPATSVEAIEQAFLGINEQLGLPKGPGIDVKSQVKSYLSSEESGPWLLIIDNADDFEMWMTSSTQPALKSFLPQCHNGFILFTSRNQQLASRLVGPDVITLSQMNDTTALELLKESLVQKDLLEDKDSAILLVQQLCGLPLALVQAASFINENCMSLDEYLGLLGDQEDTIIELLSEDFEDSYRYTETTNPVAVTWLISFQHVKKSSSLAAEFLSFIACIDHRDIPLSLLPCSGSSLEKQKALGILKAYSFVTAQVNGHLISMHRLVHLATRNWLKNESLLQEWTSKAGEHFNQVFPSCDPNNRKLWREYLPHAQSLLQSRKIQRADMVFLAICDGQFGKLEIDDGCLLEILAWMAWTYGKQGRLKEVEGCGLELIEAAKRLQGVDHPDTLAYMNNLALIYKDLGRLKEAEELGLQVTETSKRVLGIEHPETLASMSSLALVYNDLGRSKEAEELALQVLEKTSRLLGAEHPDTLIGMSSLVLIYIDLGRFKEAEELGLEVLETEKRVLGVEHRHTLDSMSNLMLIYNDLGRLKEAEELGLQVAETRKRVLGAEHPDTLKSMRSLVFIYKNLGRFKEAEELALQVLEKTSRLLGAENPDTLNSMRSLVLIYKDQFWAIQKEAEELALQVLEKTSRLLGAEHPDTLTRMWDLACTWAAMNRHAEAITMLEECGRLQEKTLGPHHSQTIKTMSTLEALKNGIL